MIRLPQVSPRAAALGFLGVLLGICYLTPFLLEPIEVDLGRDLNFAYRIATGQEWIAIGPRIGTGWHVGPVWYYILALPMLACKSITATVMFVGLLTALKFVLALQLGRRMLGIRFGVAWAILLALPGMSTLESIWVAHPSLVSVSSLAVLYALWNAHDRRSYPWLYVACLAFGLALHAHPTTLPLAVLFAVVFFRLDAGSNVARMWRLAACALLVLLPFAPLLVDAQVQARNLFDFSRDVASASLAWQERSVFNVLANLFWHVPNLVASTFLGETSAGVAVWKIFLAALHVVVVLGIGVALLRPELGLRSYAGGALAYFLFSAFVIVAVRAETRFYMTYALLPIIAFLQAIGLTAWVRSGWFGTRRLADLLLAGTIVAFSSVAIARIDESRHGYVRLPGLFGPRMDIGVALEGKSFRLDSLPMWDLDAIGELLCKAGDVHAYGDLAIAVDSQFNLPARLHCGDRSRVTLGGTPGPGATALYLLPAADVRVDRTTRPFGGLRLGVVESILYPGRGIPLAGGGDHATRAPCTSTRLHAVDFVAAPGRTIVIANSLPVHCPLRVMRLTVAGNDVTPAGDALAQVVRAPGLSTSDEWHLEVESGDIGALQVFTIAGRAAEN